MSSYSLTACSAVVDDIATEPPGSMKKWGPDIFPGLTSTPSPSTKRQPASTAPWSDLYFFLRAVSVACVEIKIYGAFVLNHRVVLHAIDARPAR